MCIYVHIYIYIYIYVFSCICIYKDKNQIQLNTTGYLYSKTFCNPYLHFKRDEFDETPRRDG